MLLFFAIFLIAVSLLLVLFSVGWTNPIDYLNIIYGDMRARIIMGVSGGFVLILGLYIFLLSIFRQPSDHTVVENTSLGEINISLRAVENLLQQAALSVRGVRDVKPIIRSDEKGVYVYLKAIISHEVNIPQASKELQDKSREILENSAGIKVVEIRVNVVDINQDARARVH